MRVKLWRKVDAAWMGLSRRGWRMNGGLSLKARVFLWSLRDVSGVERVGFVW